MAIRAGGKKIVFKKGRKAVVSSRKSRARGQGTASISITDERTGKTSTSRVDLDTGMEVSKSGSKSRTKVVPVIDKSKRLQARVVEISTGKVISKGQFKVDPRTERALRQRAIATRNIATRKKAQQDKIAKEIQRRELVAQVQGKKLDTLEKEQIKREVIGIATALPTIKKKKTLLATPTKAQIIVNKFNTGQSMTLRDKIDYSNIIRIRNEKLNKAQVKLLADVLGAPVVYGSNLAKRYEKGETNPLYNDLKAVGIGAAKESGDLINSVLGVKGVTINSRGESFDGIIAKGARTLLNYASSNAAALAKGKFKEKVTTDIKKLTSGTKAFGRGTVDVIKLIKDNPVTTMLIVSSAISSGAIKSKKEFLKNPEENLGRAIVWLFPGTIIKGVSKITKINKLTTPVEKFSTSTFKAVTDLKTDRVKVIGESKGVFNTGDNFVMDYKIVFNPKTQLWNVKTNLKTGKKTFTDTFNLIEKKGYYVNSKTGKKVAKSRGTVDNTYVKIKEQKLTPISQKVNIQGDNAYLTNKYDIETTLTKILNNVQVVSKKSSEVVLTADASTKKIVSGLSKQFDKVKAGKVGKVIKKKEIILSNAEKELEKFLRETVRYNEKLVGGLDKRTRLARALGLRKDSKIIKNLESVIDKDGKLISIIERTGKQIVTGKAIRGKEPFKLKIPKLKITLPKMVPNQLIKSKKAGYRFIQKPKIEVITKSKKVNRLNKKTLNLPEIRAKLPLTKKNIKLYGITNKLSRARKTLGKIIENTRELKNLEIQKDLIKELMKEVLKIREQIKIVDQKQKKKIKVVDKITQKTVPKQKLKQKPKAVLKKPIPRIKPKGKIAELKKPPIPKKFKFKFNWNNPAALNNKIALYEGSYRARRNERLPFNKKKNPRVTKIVKAKDTKYRAFKKIMDKVDRSTAANLQIRVTGITKQKKKDIKKPEVLIKFEKKKSKNPEILKLNEMNIFRIDKPGEVIGLRQARIKKAASSTTQKKKKTPKKASKKKKASTKRLKPKSKNKSKKK